jgi:uncharacterized membrane protein
MGENHFTSAPLALYGFVLLMAGIAYVILQQLIIAAQGTHSVLRTAVGRDWKGKASPVLYITAIACAFWSPVVSQVLYALVALMWLVPDRRIERTLAREERAG